MDHIRPDRALIDRNLGSPSGKRDAFILILGFLHLVSSCWRLYQENRILIAYIQYSGYEDPNLSLWGPPLPLVVLADLSVLFILASGIGLFLNAKWGWWLTGFVYSYAVVQAIYMIVMSYVRKQEFQQLGMKLDFAPYLRNLAVYSLLLCYLYTNRVLRSFDLSTSQRLRWTFIATQCGAALTALIITTLFAALILINYGESVPYIE